MGKYLRVGWSVTWLALKVAVLLLLMHSGRAFVYEGF
jgi:hypothetical protein